MFRLAKRLLLLAGAFAAVLAFMPVDTPDADAGLFSRIASRRAARGAPAIFPRLQERALGSSAACGSCGTNGAACSTGACATGTACMDATCDVAAEKAFLGDTADAVKSANGSLSPGWKVGPPPQGTFWFGGVVLQGETDKEGFHFASFKGDHIRLDSSSGPRVELSEVAFYNDSIYLPHRTSTSLTEAVEQPSEGFAAAVAPPTAGRIFPGLAEREKRLGAREWAVFQILKSRPDLRKKVADYAAARGVSIDPNNLAQLLDVLLAFFEKLVPLIRLFVVSATEPGVYVVFADGVPLLFLQVA